MVGLVLSADCCCFAKPAPRCCAGALLCDGSKGLCNFRAHDGSLLEGPSQLISPGALARQSRALEPVQLGSGERVREPLRFGPGGISALPRGLETVPQQQRWWCPRLFAPR